MKLYYESKSAKWYHSCLEAVVTIGGERQSIPLQTADSKDSCYDLRFKTNHAGPLIGIMTARKANGTVAGNGHLFMELQKKLISLHGISFIFTLDGIRDTYIDGYIFSPEINLWNKIRAPYPDLIYNRVPFRKSEQEETYQSVISTFKEKKIPFFNPGFIDKYDLHRILQSNTILKEYLPDTELIENPQEFYSFLETHHCVYLKPSQSSRGKGIFRLQLKNKAEIYLEGLKKSVVYPSFQKFWEDWRKVLIEKNYIIQEEIHSAKYDGKRFDFRILAHAKKEGYVVTGVGIRQSQKQELTTHIPNGGKLLPYELLQSNEHDKFFEKVVDHVGKSLTEQFGFFGEFSIDAGISISGKYYIYEVNSKPMSFDETVIEERKMEQLCHLFLQITDFE